MLCLAVCRIGGAVTGSTATVAAPRSGAGFAGASTGRSASGTVEAIGSSSSGGAGAGRALVVSTMVDDSSSGGWPAACGWSVMRHSPVATDDGLRAA